MMANHWGCVTLWIVLIDGGATGGGDKYGVEILPWEVMTPRYKIWHEIWHQEAVDRTSLIICYQMLSFAIFCNFINFGNH
jgi:hypothetical protein